MKPKNITELNIGDVFTFPNELNKKKRRRYVIEEIDKRTFSYKIRELFGNGDKSSKTRNIKPQTVVFLRSVH